MRARPAVVAAACLVAPALAHADPTVDTLAADATALAARGDFLGAAAKYEDANALSPRVALVCNVGVAYHKANDLPRAHRFLSECVRRGTGLDEAFVSAVRATLADIDRQLHVGAFAEVELRVEPADATIVVSEWNPREALTGPQSIWLAFGAHHLTAHAAGYRDEQRDLTVENASVSPITIRLVAEPTAPPSGGTSPERSPARAPGPPPARPAPDERPGRTPVYVGAALTGGAALATLVTYLGARSKIAAVDPNAATQAAYDHEADTARHWRDGFLVSAATTVIAAGVTGYLWHSSSTAVTVVPATTGAAAVLAGRF